MKAEFKIDDEQLETYIQKLNAVSTKEVLEPTINEYLKNSGGRILVEEITKRMPISKRKKPHAKNSKWHKIQNFNLSVVVSTQQKFDYLKFPNNALGTSKNNMPQYFFEEGGDKASSIITNDLIDIIEKI